MARHQALRQPSLCIYCGTPLAPDEVTVDHVPPLVLFDFRDRPKGLEFPSCKACNNGMRLTDFVVAALSRIYPDGPTAAHTAELQKLMEGMTRRAPEVLREMAPYKAMARNAMRRTGRTDGGILRLSGEATTGHLEKFAARFGFAMHYLATNRPVAADGAVIVRVYTNMDLIDGEFPAPDC